MDRETMNETLSKVLGREASRDEITSMMNLFNENLKKGVAEATQKNTETLNASWEQKLTEQKAQWDKETAEKYSGYHTADEYNDILNQLNTFKGEQKRNALYEKLRAGGVKDKKSVLDYALSNIGEDEDGFDDRLAEWTKNEENAEFMAQPDVQNNGGYGKQIRPTQR